MKTQKRNPAPGKTAQSPRSRETFRFFYTYRRENHARDGNPRHWINVFQLVRETADQKLPGGVLLKLNAEPVPVGYSDAEQTAYDVIAANVPALAKFPAGYALPAFAKEFMRDREAIAFKSGFSCTFPGYLAREMPADLPALYLQQIATP